jgi:hypothetical protein
MAQDGSLRRTSLVFPIVLIGFGVLFLLSRWNPAFEPWSILRTYWPLILIFIGMGKIWDNVQRSRNPNEPPGISLGATFGAVAFVLVIGMLIWHGRGFSHGRDGMFGTKHTTKIVEPQRAKSAHAKLDMSAGQLTINGGSAHLLEADFNYSDSYDEPRVEYSVAEGVGQLTVSQDSRSVHIGHSENDWSLHFSKDLPLELRIDMGAGQGNLHLRDVPLTRLDLNIGAGQVDVDLTGDRKTDLTADIEGGVGQANIRLPKNVGVIVHASGGIGSVESHGLKHEDDTYTNDAYGKTPATIRLKVQGGIGQIVLSQEL